MAVYTGPKFGSTDFDASRWRDLYSNIFATGVVKNARVQGASGGDLAASATSGLGWSVATGAAVIKGFACIVDTSAATGTLAAADPSLPRIDTVVLSWAYSSGVPTLSVTAVTGTPASSPVAPALTQNDTTYQLALADCRVNAAATTIASVTDRRTYAIAVIPYTIGHAAGNVPISDGTLNTTLNADLLDGLNSGNANGNIPVSNGTMNTNLNADLLHGHAPGSGNGLDADTVDGLQAVALAQAGTHNTISPIKISAGTTLPGTLDANEIFFLLA